MILTYEWLVRNLTPNFQADLLGPSSADMTLDGHIIAHREMCFTEKHLFLQTQQTEFAGQWFYDPRRSYPEQGELWVRQEVKLKPKNAYLFRPGHFYLCQSEQVLPKLLGVAAIVMPKSTRARQGCAVLNSYYPHQALTYVDVGYRGRITIELTFACPKVIYVGEPIAQLVFVQTDTHPSPDYEQTGRYFDSLETTDAKPPRMLTDGG